MSNLEVKLISMSGFIPVIHEQEPEATVSTDWSEYSIIFFAAFFQEDENLIDKT